MSSTIKPIKIWGQGGPNPPKVMMILEELSLPYDIVPVAIADVKKPEYTIINPNGRIPAIYDPNTDITLWESGAIVEYLIERYDKNHLISFPPGTPESYHAKQWLFFQVSGQGPYYGQAAWFIKFHSEKLPSAIERYAKEVNRVTGVLHEQLTRQKQVHSGETNSDGPWLVGNRISYADIACVSYQRVISLILDRDQYDVDNFPLVKEWLDKMTSREKVKTAIEIGIRGQ